MGESTRRSVKWKSISMITSLETDTNLWRPDRRAIWSGWKFDKIDVGFVRPFLQWSCHKIANLVVGYAVVIWILQLPRDVLTMQKLISFIALLKIWGERGRGSFPTKVSSYTWSYPVQPFWSLCCEPPLSSFAFFVWNDIWHTTSRSMHHLFRCFVIFPSHIYMGKPF